MKKILSLIVALSFCFCGYGQVMFENTFDDAGTGGEFASSVKQTNDNGYIMTGFTWNQSGAQYDALLVKTDMNGSLVWSKTFGGDSADFGTSVIQTNDGGYFVAGTSENFGAGDSNVYTIRTNSAGDTLWTKIYGGINNEYAKDVKQTSSDGFIIVGGTNSFGSGNLDVYVVCLNAFGDTLWTRAYGGPLWDEGSSIQLTQDGGYIVCGTSSSFGNQGPYLIKLDSAGNLIWDRSYRLDNGFPPNGQRGNSVKQTADGGYIMIGDNYIATCVFKTDVSGNFQWGVYCVMGPEFCYGIDIVQIGDGGYVLASTEEWFPPTYYIVLVKLDGSGNLIWSESFTPQISNETGSLTLANDGGYAIAGWTADWTFPQDNKLCLIKTNSSGFNGCQSAFSVSCVSYPAIIDSGCVVSTTQTVSTGTWTNVATLSLTTVNYCFATQTEENKNSYLILSPNPAANELIVSGSEFGNKNEFSIYNLLGEKIYSQQETRSPEPVTVDVSQLPSGIYFVRVKTDTGMGAAKFVKE